jgi:type IV secretion system protein TrbI
VDTNNKPDHEPLADPGEEVVKGAAPSGIDLHPQPQKAVRLSRRTTVMILSVVVLLLLGFAYGGYRRTQSNQSAAREAGLPKSVTPATQAASEFMQATPAGTVPMALRPPDVPAPPQTTTAPCGADPKTEQPYRFNPQTGQPCDGLPQERVVVRQPNAIRTPPVAPIPVHEETPEERRLAAAYQREQEAIQAPTSVRNSAASSLSPTVAQPASSDLSQVEALSHALGARQGGDSATPPNGQALENDYDSQNMQSRKEVFLAANRTRQADDYLRSNREAPLSRYEIKAGWEIPAILEQSLNSDLPGTQGVSDLQRLRHCYWSLPSNSAGLPPHRQI